MKDLTFDRIVEAAQLGETTELEFKSAKGGFPGSFWESYSAMANTDGGTIILGAREKDDSIKLEGLTQEQINTYTKKLMDDLHNKSKVSANILENHHVKQISAEQGFLLCITIPAAARRQRPVFLGQIPFGNTYRRNYEGDYRCSDDEVRRMFADADPEITADMRILEGFSLADLDSSSLTQYRQRFRAAKGDHAWLALEDREFLEKLGGWRRDRKSGIEGITVAGLLIFGKHQAIIDPHAVPLYFVDYREKMDPATRWTDRIYPDGTWESNLFQYYQRVWPKISAGLPVPFQLEQGMRRDETPAHEALREAFVNTIIHADYFSAGGIIAERYPDKFFFDNPGFMLVSLEQYRKGGISECRNKSLQRMFLMIGGGEQAGSGVDKIRTGWKSRSWRIPWIHLSTAPNRVKLTLPMVSLIPDDVMSSLNSQFGLESISILSPSELQALATASIEGIVSNARLQELLSEHPVDITKMLQKLCEEEYLQSDNKKRWTNYRLSTSRHKQPSLFDPLKPEESKKSQGLSGQENTLVENGAVRTADSTIQFDIVVKDGQPIPSQITKDSAHLSGNSIHIDRNAPILAGDSIHKNTDSIHLAGDSIQSIGPEVVALAAKSAHRRRINAHEMRNIIKELCTNRYLSLEQLAQLLNRNATALRNQHIRPMVKEGIIVLRFPDAPNRPDQAYTAAKK